MNKIVFLALFLVSFSNTICAHTRYTLKEVEDAVTPTLKKNSQENLRKFEEQRKEIREEMYPELEKLNTILYLKSHPEILWTEPEFRPNFERNLNLNELIHCLLSTIQKFDK